MRYEVRVPRKVAKQLASLPANTRERIVERLEALGHWPEHGQDVKILKGDLAGCYRLRCGKYRVLFQVIDEPRVIAIEKIGARGSVYE